MWHLFLLFFQYYSKRGSKDFKGMDTTKAAIESSKKSKGGRQRFLVLSENDVKILKRDAKVRTGRSNLMILCYFVVLSLSSRVVLPTQAENILPALGGTRREKREDNK